MNGTGHNRNTTLLIGSREESFATDKPMLRSSGAGRMLFMQNPIKAATELAHMEPASLPPFIVCSDPKGMDNASFLRLLRLHPKLFSLPVLLICSSINKDALLEANSLGHASVLVRPYTQKNLDTAILSAIKAPSILEPAKNSEMFEQAISNLSSPTLNRAAPTHNAHGTAGAAGAAISPHSQKAKEENNDLLLKGNSLLRRGKFKEAIAAFGDVLSLASDHRKAEALENIAEAYSGLGMPDDTQTFLQRAAVAFLADDNFFAARLAFAKLYPQEERKNMGNPLYKAGSKLLQQADYSMAAQAFLQGYAFTPDDFFASTVARSCQLSASPLEHIEEICKAVEHRSPSIGRTLRANLLPEERPAEIEEKEGVWGMICEVFAVARHTAKVAWS